MYVYMDKRYNDAPIFFLYQIGKTCTRVNSLSKQMSADLNLPQYTKHSAHPTLKKCLIMKIQFLLPTKCKPIITMYK